MRSKDKTKRMRLLLDQEFSSADVSVLWRPRSVGSYHIRFLPDGADPDGPVFWYKTYVHYNMPGSRRGFLCPRLTFGEKCPICERISVLRASKNKADNEIAESWTARAKYVANILVVKSPVENDADKTKVRVWANIPRSVLSQIRDLLSVEDEEGNEVYDAFHDWEFGSLMHLSRTGDSWTDTRYSITPVKEYPVDRAEFEDKIYNLEEYVRDTLASTMEELEQAMLEEEEMVDELLMDDAEREAEDIAGEIEEENLGEDEEDAVEEEEEAQPAEDDDLDLEFLDRVRDKLGRI